MISKGPPPSLIKCQWLFPSLTINESLATRGFVYFPPTPSTVRFHRFFSSIFHLVPSFRAANLPRNNSIVDASRYFRKTHNGASFLPPGRETRNLEWEDSVARIHRSAFRILLRGCKLILATGEELITENRVSRGGGEEGSGNSIAAVFANLL